MPHSRHFLNRISLLAALLIIGGCETLDGFMAGLKKKPGPDVVAFEDRPVVDPIDANTFVLESDEQTLVGEPQIVFTGPDDTFSDLARTYGLGYDELLAANPGIDPWLPGEGTAILLPTQFVLPDAPKRGVILNIASKRLFYYPEVTDGELPKVLTYPIGIGRVGWETPLGETTVVAKAENPTWWVPASVRQEHADAGDPLPSIVPPGPDNPLGTRVLKLNMPGYLIHGTNQPYGVGMRVSHGCVRLYPENIEFLYTLVDIGEVVTIMNEPYQMGRLNGRLYFEAHPPLEDDEIPAAERLQRVLDAHNSSDGQALNAHLHDHVAALAQNPNGVPTSIVEYDAAEVLARARVVHNIVEPDPNEPTLSEVREMMEAIEAEIEADAAVSSPQ
ncbi:MAG TPA: L,D-transpeptidase family protein [Woeseiaceae bacterium]|nr:L,D-transpeptidase family protein [Woeseiaceae bacterium]